jgi:hypothetical protein
MVLCRVVSNSFLNLPAKVPIYATLCGLFAVRVSSFAEHLTSRLKTEWAGAFGNVQWRKLRVLV